MRSIFKVFFSVILATTLSSCGFSFPAGTSSASSPLPGGIRGTVPVVGDECRYRFLCFLPISSRADSADALEDAKTDGNVDVITDVTVDYRTACYILFSNECVRIRGLGVPRELSDKIKQQAEAQYK